jgi:adenine-specific DNA-methyltransferase
MVYNIIKKINEKDIKTSRQSGGHIGINKIIQMKKEKIYNIKNPKDLLEFINENLAPKQIEKKTRGEVFTPMALVNEMLDKLPKDVWENKNLKWLDPAAGMGNFPVAVYMRLMEGLKKKMSSEEERRKHILEKMLYMVEIDKANVFMMKKIFCGGTYKLNIYEGSFLQYKEAKFDIVMGNPPFQNTNEEGERIALNSNLWSVFIDLSFNKFLKDDGYLLFITPTSWMSPAPSNKNKDVFYNNYIIHLNIKECEKYFKGVGSEFSYYLIKKTTDKKETTVICMYDNNIYESKMLIDDVLFLPTLLTDKSLTIIRKFYNNKLEKVSFKTSSELHRTTKKSLIAYCNDKDFIHPLRHTETNKGLCSNIKHSLGDKNKILLNLSGYLDPLYDKGKLGFTQAQMYLLTNNKSYVDILNSKLYKFIFKICKWSGFNIENVFKNIPYIEGSGSGGSGGSSGSSGSDDKLYHLFKLTKDERSFINKIV